jgi:hypothetical protein
MSSKVEQMRALDRRPMFVTKPVTNAVTNEPKPVTNVKPLVTNADRAKVAALKEDLKTLAADPQPGATVAERQAKWRAEHSDKARAEARERMRKVRANKKAGE